MATYNKRGYKAPKPEQEEKDIQDPIENISEQESTTAEVFNNLDSGANKIEDWIKNNQKPIFGAIISVMVVVGGIFAYKKFVVEPKEDEAANHLHFPQTHFEQAVNGVASDSLFNLALNGAEGKHGFLKIIEHYPSTDAANLAHYYAGISYLNLHKYKEAIAELDQFSSKDMILSALAKGAIGDAFVQNKQLEEALGYYEKAFEINSNDLTTPRFLLKAGQVALSLGKKDKALAYFSRIQNDFATSQEAMNIDALIGLSQ